MFVSKQGPVVSIWYKALDRLVVGGTTSAAIKKMLLDQVRDSENSPPLFLYCPLLLWGGIRGNGAIDQFIINWK